MSYECTNMSYSDELTGRLYLGILCNCDLGSAPFPPDSLIWLGDGHGPYAPDRADAPGALASAWLLSPSAYNWV